MSATGWICPQCRASVAPSEKACPKCVGHTYGTLGGVKFVPNNWCSCPPGALCGNIACPRRPVVTCLSTTSAAYGTAPIFQ